MAQFRTLIDIYNSRPDVQAAFPQGLTPGADDNRKLNDWWNRVHTEEFPGVTLVQPGDSRIEEPKEAAEPTQPTDTSRGLYKNTSTGKLEIIPHNEVSHRSNVQRTSYEQINDISQQELERLGIDIGDVQSIGVNVTTPQPPPQPPAIDKVNAPPTPTEQPFQQKPPKELLTPPTQRLSKYPPISPDEFQTMYWERDKVGGHLYHQQLNQIYASRPDLQEVFNADGSGKAGTDWEGFNLEFWAMQFGWNEYPEQLASYNPVNTVRTAYMFDLRGEDPLSDETFDKGALDWAEAIEGGNILDYASLNKGMRADESGEWENLPAFKKVELLERGEIPPETLPSFTEFFDEEATKKSIDIEVDKYYDEQLTDYLKTKGIVEKREIEDWARVSIGDITQEEGDQLLSGEITATELQEKLKGEGRELGEVTEEEERELTDAQLQFRQTVKSAIEGYALKGLARSSIRLQGEEMIRGELARKQGQIQSEAQKLREQQERESKRSLEDIKIKAEAAQKEIGKEGRERAKEKATEFQAAEEREFGKFKALKAGLLTKEELGI